MAEEIKIDGERFWKRLDKMFHSWKDSSKSWNDVDSMMIVSVGEDPIYRKSLALELYLFGYELLNTIFVFCKKTHSVYIVSGDKAGKILRQVGEKKKMGETTYTLNFIKKNKSDGYKSNTEALVQPMQESGGVCGILKREPPNGSMVTAIRKKIDETFEIKDVALGIAELLAIKDRHERENVQLACNFASQTLKKFVVPQIETVIDEEKDVKHSELARKIEDVFDNPKSVHSDIAADLLESCYTPIIQSGGKYNLKASAMSNDNNLQYSGAGATIIVALGARFKSYCSNIARTYFIDASKEQEKVYNCLLEVYTAVLSALKDGVKLSAVWAAAVSVIERKKPELVAKFTRNCGFATGIEFRESSYVIKAKSERTARSGMIFNICIGFENLHDREKAAKGDEKAANYAVMIADTVLVTNEAPQKLTHAVRRMKDVSYTLDAEDSDEDEESNSKSQNSSPEKKKKDSNSSSSSRNAPDVNGLEEGRRTRGSRNGPVVEKNTSAEVNRRQKQSALAKRKHTQNIKKYVEKDGAAYESEEESDYEDVVAYRSMNAFPKANRTRIVVDDVKDTILFPINGTMTPFHISTIKNVQGSSVSGQSYLRVNFVTPSSGIRRSAKRHKAVIHHTNCLWIKELNYRARGSELVNIERQIKNMSKRVKQREEEKEKEGQNQVILEQLVIQRDRRYVPRLAQLKIKPAVGGRKKKGAGMLEAHTNGFRYTSNAGHKVDITYNNIKHAFFQPCKSTVSVILHFELIQPIVYNRRKTNGVQVYYEVVDASVDIDKSGGSFYDRDGLREEHHERQLKKKWNRNFHDFVTNAEKVIHSNKQCKKIEFEVPHGELTFSGVPNKSEVKITPAVNCLVSLEDSPVWCLSLKEVEIAHFERVQFQLRAFDLVFVFKDFKKPVCRVDAIPRQHLENLKEYLTDAGILFYEGAVNLDWTRIMKEIRDDTRGFFQQGGWSFLDAQENNNAENAEGGADSNPDDSDFAPDEGGFEASEESEDSEEYGSDSEFSDESDESMEEVESDEEGPSWEELEKQAIREDHRKRFGEDEDDSRNKKKKKRRRGRY